MKTLLLGSTILSFILFFSAESNSQELAKPIPNKVAQKQASPQKTESNTSNESISGKKSDLTKGESNNSGTTPTRIQKESNPAPLATRDSDDYQAKKSKWISENPEKYKAHSGNPNLVIMTEEELKKLPSEEQTKILADEENYLIIK